MLIRAGYDLTFAADVPTPMIAMLSVHPSRLADLRKSDNVRSAAATESYDYQDCLGNICTRLIIPRGGTTLSCDFLIEDSGLADPQSPGAEQHDLISLPPEFLTYLLGSRYCDTDRLAQKAWALFGHLRGWDCVQAIVDFVHDHLEYGYQHARATRTASEAYEERVGVCRDFAHLAVTLCRCMNIPARYCSGYLGDIGIKPLDVPMDFHAWFEVYLGHQWHSFDARHRIPRIGRILMAAGRDAADTALTTAFGPAPLTGFNVYTYEVDDLANSDAMPIAA